MLQEAQSLLPTNHDIPIKLANILYTDKTGDPELLCLKVLAKEPKNGEALLLMGKIRWKEGKNKEAINFLEKAVKV
jgi:cytochrome c-type biogenesis protein CcmH/NrfG